MADAQSWDPERYARDAGFVAELGQPVVNLLSPRAGERILDLGCGPGKQTLVLARHFRTPVIAVDFHAPYLECLRRSAEAEGLSDLVQTRLGRMEELEEQPGSVDLIWIEGAIFIVGFGEGLGARFCVTGACWSPAMRRG